jgi:hypothetical protein
MTNSKEYNRAYYKKNHTKIRLRQNICQKAYRAKNREKVNEYERVRYFKPEIHEKRKAQMRAYGKKHYVYS